MGEPALLVAHTLAYLGLLAALGSGPTLALGLRGRDSALLAPILGFAAAAAVLTSITEVLPMRVAAWALLLPAAAISLAAAAWLGWRRKALRARLSRLAAIPLAVALLGLVLAILPGLLRGTEGPIGLAVYDGLGYIQTDKWLQEHTAREPLPADAARFDLSETYGRALAGGDQRIGVSAVNAASASLFLAEPDQTHLPLLAVLLSLLPIGIWVVARTLGAGAAGAAFGSLFGLSPALLSLVDDSALGNLAVLVLIPPALLLGALWIREGGLGTFALAAILAAGIVAVYPEFVLPTLAIGGLGLLSLLIANRARLRDRAWLRSLVVRPSLLIAAAAAVTPIGLTRAYSYLAHVGASIGGQPPRFLTAENGWAWAFGTVTLYELPRFGFLSGLKAAVAIGVPAALTLCLLLGLARTTLLRAAFVGSPILVAITMGLISFSRYQGGHCEYCLWKSLTLLLPFLGIGLGLGVHELLRGKFGRPSVRAATRVAAAVVALTAIASIARSDADLTRAEYETAAIVTPEMRRIADLTRAVPDSAGLLLEGTDASAAPKWTTPATYYFASLDRKGPMISLVPSGDAALYLGIGSDRGEQFYSPAYQYVLSLFGGIASGRVALSREGSFTLYRRAKIDASMVGTGWALDPAEGAHAIPWLQGPFQLWLSTGAEKGPIALEMGLKRPLHDGSSLSFSVGSEPVGALSSSDGSRLCVQLDPDRDPLVVDVEPEFDHSPLPAVRASETAPIPPPPKVLGLDLVEAEPGTCLDRLPDAVPALGYGAGWYPLEQGAGGTSWHWMQTQATLVVGAAGVSRPATQLRATVGSLVIARKLSVRLDGRAVGEFEVPAGFASRRLVLPIPGGEGQALLKLEATPGAQSAESVTPGDTRRLAVVMIHPTLRPLHDGP